MVQVAYMILMFWDTNVLPRKSDLNLSKFHSGQVIIFLQSANTFTKTWILLSSWSHTLMNTVAATLAPKLCTIGTLSDYWRWLISRFVALDIIKLLNHHLLYHHVCYANLSGPLTREAQFLWITFEKHSKILKGALAGHLGLPRTFFVLFVWTSSCPISFAPLHPNPLISRMSRKTSDSRLFQVL